MNNIPYKRKDPEPPLAVEAWGWRYHHIGIPVTQACPRGAIFATPEDFREWF